MAGSERFDSRADYGAGVYDPQGAQDAQQRLWQSAQIDRNGDWRGHMQAQMQPGDYRGPVKFYHGQEWGLDRFGNWFPLKPEPPRYSFRQEASFSANSTEALVFGTSRDAIVKVDTNVGTGTGFFINRNGELATVYHVIAGEDPNQITVKTASGKEYKATIEAVDKVNDLALLKVIAPANVEFSAVPLGSSNLPMGEGLMALGHPKGVEEIYASPGHYVRHRVLRPSRYHGPLTERDDPNRPYLELKMHTEGGNSGSPVLNRYGQVVGMACRSDSKSETYATPVEMLERLLYHAHQRHYGYQNYYNQYRGS